MDAQRRLVTMFLLAPWKLSDAVSKGISGGGIYEPMLIVFREEVASCVVLE